MLQGASSSAEPIGRGHAALKIPLLVIHWGVMKLWGAEGGGSGPKKRRRARGSGEAEEQIATERQSGVEPPHSKKRADPANNASRKGIRDTKNVLCSLHKRRSVQAG
jgi:hypothetical protein